jgi:hypothetical protein
MNITTLLFMLLSFSLLIITLITILIKNCFTNDLLFFLLAGIIYSVTILLFYFYFQDDLIAFIASGLLLTNNSLMLKEIAYIDKNYLIYCIPFLLFIIYWFLELFAKLI